MMIRKVLLVAMKIIFSTDSISDEFPPRAQTKTNHIVRKTREKLWLEAFFNKFLLHNLPQFYAPKYPLGDILK